MTDYIEKPDVQYILHIKSDKKVEKRLIDYCLESVVDVFEDTGLTTDIQPVKSGRWEYSEEENGDCAWYFCSVCDSPAEQLYTDEPLLSEFCPHCGADMRGDQN